MGNLNLRLVWLGILISIGHMGIGQSTWGSVTLNRSSVYVGQPIQVSVTAYTSTWFTKGVDLGNIKVNGAFTVYFRSVSKSEQIKGKTYAGVEMIYNVFPYNEEDIVFPALEITVETPAEGSSKGVKRILKTAPKNITVKPVPPNFEKSEWLVASGLSVSENWQGDLDNVKVGDVLSRSIKRTAYGTVSELIPAVHWDSIPSISNYPTRSELNNNKSKTAISSNRTETMRYLFEKEGEVILPEMVFSWYNSYQNKLYKRTLKERRIMVKPNPDLGMLASIRDSLNVDVAKIAETEEDEKSTTILGMTLKEFIVTVVVVILSLVLLFYLLKMAISKVREKYSAYRKSELYYFNRLKKAIKQGQEKDVVNALYRWIDELDMQHPCFKDLVNTNDDTLDKLNTSQGLEASAATLTIAKVKNLRHNFFNSPINIENKDLWIQPPDS